MAERKCVLALGFFDGVHRGHAALLNRTIERAEALGVEGAVMTFDTHPDTLVQGTPVPLINSAPDRANLIRRLFGIDRVEFFRFTEETMHMPWEEFLRSIQAELGVVGFVVGYDFRFGWRGEGNTGRLRDYCAANGLTCDVVDKVEIDGITVSSTYIRSLLREGDMLRAEYFMGHPHFLTDVVRHGHRLGHHLGAPTVNMQFAPGVLVPPHGVYAARALLPEGEFPAVTNIGVRPTVSSEPVVTVESHLLGFDGNLYGRTLALEFFDFLRPERRFADLDELGAQIARDGERARQIVEAFGEEEPVATVPGQTTHVLELTRLYATDEAIRDGIDFYGLSGFSLVICKPDRKIIYSDCQWSSISEAGTLGAMVVEKVTIVASKRIETGV